MDKTKLIAFDVDGVLVSSEDVHYYSFKDALASLNIAYDRAINSIIKDFSTDQKLDYLQKFYDFEFDRATIKHLKFELINKYRSMLALNPHVKATISELAENHFIALVSNARTKYVSQIAELLDITSSVDVFIGNDLGVPPKPSPAMYEFAMSYVGVTKENTIIFEDSEIGLAAAYSSGANVFHVKSFEDLKIDNVKALLK